MADRRAIAFLDLLWLLDQVEERRSRVPWIGALKIEQRPRSSRGTVLPGVLVTLAPAKSRELREAIYTAKGMVQAWQVEKVAQQLSWAGGVFTWTRGFNSCLWAALAAHTMEQAKQETADAAFLRSAHPAGH